MKSLRRAFPVVVVIAATIALGYPLALLFGLPLARQRMESLSNWSKATVTAMPVTEVPPRGEGAVLPTGTTLRFDHVPESSLLVRDGSPLETRYRPGDAGSVVLEDALPLPLVEFGAALERLSSTSAGDAQLFRLPEGADLAQPLYLRSRLLQAGTAAAVERADGQRTQFHFEDNGDGPVLVGASLMLEGVDQETSGRSVTFASAPPFNAEVRRITGDYAVVDVTDRTIALAQATVDTPRTANASVRLAERLEGAVDGTNRVFRTQHTPLIETDRARRMFLGEQELSAEPERPEERVDGVRASFTFPGSSGIVTVNGVAATEGRDFQREGNLIHFSRPVVRNAALRQYRDYLVNDPATGSVTLAVPPPPGSDLWALSYTYYGAPTCGRTAMACFLSMSQHPVPFPHWIAQRVVPYFTNYPLADRRNIVRAVLYTATGTLWALLLGGAVGVLLAVAFVSVRPLEQALLPWVIASQTVPIIALVPVLLLILGNAGITVQTSLIPTALIGAYIAFFPVTVGTVTGLRSVDPLALDLMKSYAASPIQVFLKVRFPAAVPFLFTSLKLGTAAALVGALVAETESNNSRGLGYAIIGQVQAGDVADVWLLLIVSAVLGIGLVSLVGLLQRLTAPWERT